MEGFPGKQQVTGISVQQSAIRKNQELPNRVDMLHKADCCKLRAAGSPQVMARSRAFQPSIMRIVKGEFIGQICDQQVG